MKNTITYNVALGLIITFFCSSLNAQSVNSPNTSVSDVYKANQRVSQYMELRKLGYEEKAIFEDLGNANFLAGNYDNAVFWYDKLKEVSDTDMLSNGFQKRYQYALGKTSTGQVATPMKKEDWLASIKEDYELDTPKRELAKYRPLDTRLSQQEVLEQELLLANNAASNNGMTNGKNTFTAPITVTADGKTAFFSKAVYVKPEVGLFSKKELVYKIYKANKVHGKWQNIKELALCPKYYSALHPAVSYDGKRLFFTSDMPGTYGKYDIYVSNIRKDGTLDVAKNLGQKVNTKKNEMYPKIVGANTLFFASDGRKGLGGLDVYMAEVNSSNVGLAINLGDTLNSREDDYSIRFLPEQGMAYVVSSRGKDEGDLHQVAFSYHQPSTNIPEEKTAYTLLEAINSDSKTDYSTSVFEDE
ncbi:cell envelope biogenesis protein OmpA [Maribacter polysiphoniae]|uniref:cell envelope biogenesis protein OmpA n=1 Tax=Maribacter polysiphoniae TaxID=429344 RepID=UPI0023556C98|nr:cell envelope biogenesis protein OmpA [Maribacter polysiphoniae]